MRPAIEALKDPHRASLDVPQVFAVLSNHTRLNILEELERQGFIPFGRFKDLLDVDNDSVLNGHLEKLAAASLIRKSPHVNAWELTEQGSRLLNLVESMRGETRRIVGPAVNIVISGKMRLSNFREVENALRSKRSLVTVSRTSDSLSVRLDDQWTDATLEVRADGQFTAKGKVPLTSVLSVTKASDLRKVEEQFVNFFNLVPEESSLRPAIADQTSRKIQSWILMANSLIWTVVYFLYSSVVSMDPQSSLTSIQYRASME